MIRILRRTAPALALAAMAILAPAARADFIDPAGDTFGAGAVQIDLTTVEGDVTGLTQTTFTLNFAGPISAASAAAANSVIGFVELDLDLNAGTGVTPLINGFSPAPPISLGVELYIDLGSEIGHAGLVDVFDASNTLVATVGISYTPTSLTFSIPFVGTGPGGEANYGIVVGTFLESTDRAPNGETPAQTIGRDGVIPEPASVVLLGLGVLGLGVYGLRRRIAAR